ncbi:MAG: phosphonate-binding protein, partial [Alphaproteobacteria bacterium]
DLIPAPPEPPPPRLLSAHGLRAAGRWLAPVETLEKMADLRAANTADRGRLSDAALIDLGWTADQAKQVIAALKTERARQPDKPGVAPKPPKDSPFAALAVLTPPPTPPARAKRRRPRKKTAAV